MTQNSDLLPDNRTLADFPEPGSKPPILRDSGWWFTVSAYVIGVLIVVAGPALGGTALWRGIAALILFAASFGLVWLVRYMLSRCVKVRTRWSHGGHYAGIYEVAARHKRELEASQSLIRRMLSQLPCFANISLS